MTVQLQPRKAAYYDHRERKWKTTTVTANPAGALLVEHASHRSQRDAHVAVDLPGGSLDPEFTPKRK
jgi:hypothetical protein